MLVQEEVSKAKVLQLGNEAVATALLHEGVRYFAAYPGTPSSEITSTAEKMAAEYNAVVHWSSNEAVALEEAAAAAIAGKFAAYSSKHVGLNVAADPLLTVAYMGVRGALVVNVADDPGMHSSQNEQDTRWYGRLGHLPIIEPIDPQTAYDLSRKAVEISHKFEIPVIFRLTTRISHALAPIEHKPPKNPPDIPFERDQKRFICIPSSSRPNKQRLNKVWERLREWVETANLWEEYDNGARVGIIASGVAAAYAWEAVAELNNQADLLIPFMTHPLPQNKIIDFLQTHDVVLVVEELDDVLEREIKLLAYENNLHTKIHGKDLLPWDGEFTFNIVLKAVKKVLNVPDSAENELSTEIPNELIIPRPPVFCSGCPHSATYFALHRVLRKKDAIYANDIGCYSLGALPPFNAADVMLCMGSSISAAVGFSETVPDKPAVALIGDSTFWHTGISGLANAIWHNANILVIVLDNRVTAMTGMQENPSAVDVPPEQRLSIEKTAEAMGAKVWTLDPFDEKAMRRAIREAVNTPGVKVIVAKRECAIVESYHLRKENKPQPPPVDVNQETCTRCGICYEKFVCPAIGFSVEENKVVIDQALCTGCYYCAVICPTNSFYTEQQSPNASIKLLPKPVDLE